MQSYSSKDTLNHNICSRNIVTVPDTKAPRMLTRVEETTLLLRKGSRENIPTSRDVKQFKPNLPKSPSSHKPFRLFTNQDLLKMKTLAEQTHSFINSGLRNNTPIDKKSYGPTPVSPKSLSTRDSGSLMTAKTSRSSTTTLAPKTKTLAELIRSLLNSGLRSYIPMDKKRYTLTTPVAPNFSTRGRESLDLSAKHKRKSITLTEEVSLQRSSLRELKHGQSMNSQKFPSFTDSD